jgi:hypothetical protein
MSLIRNKMNFEKKNTFGRSSHFAGKGAVQKKSRSSA